MNTLGSKEAKQEVDREEEKDSSGHRRRSSDSSRSSHSSSRLVSDNHPDVERFDEAAGGRKVARFNFFAGGTDPYDTPRS